MGRTFHLSDANPIASRRVYEIIAQHAGRRLPRAPWSNALVRTLLRLRLPGIERLVREPRQLVDYLNHLAIYNNPNTLEMLEGSRVGARIDAGAVPILDAARRHGADGVFPGGTHANLDSVDRRARFRGALKDDEITQLLLADAQTSGGLLAAVSPRKATRILADLKAAGSPDAAVIGEVVEGRPRLDVR